MKILHVITDLNVGGSEMVLYRLLAGQDRKEFLNEVVSLTDIGPVGRKISELGIPVTALEVQSGSPNPRLVTGLRKVMTSFRPHLVQSWMYHADLAAGLAGRLTGKPPIVWGLHHTVSDKNSLKATTKVVARINASLSYFIPEKVVCCAEATRLSHITLGYAPGKMMVIPNGIDPAVFRPDPAARRDVRHELSLGDGTPLIGLCARFDHQKDHENFMRAAGLLHKKYPQAHFLLWGKDIVATNESISGWIRSAGVNGVTHLLGLRHDTQRLMASLDVSSLSSAYGEALPLVVGEAMACGVPCVVTDVGDAALVVGDTGYVVPPSDPAALANGWAELLSLPEPERHSLGVRARQRIIDQYIESAMVSAYSQLYRDIIAGSGVK